MSDHVPVPQSLACLAAVFFIFVEAFLFLGSSFGQYEPRLAAPGEGPLPLTLNGFPYSFIGAAAILIWVYGVWVAGASIARDQFSARKLRLAGALQVLSSLLLLAALMLVITYEMRSDDVVWYTTGTSAYVLIALPIVAGIALLMAGRRPIDE